MYGKSKLLDLKFIDVIQFHTKLIKIVSPFPDGNAVASERGASYNGEVWFKAATIAVPVCGALILFLLVAVAVRLLKADALLHADRKLRYVSAAE